MSIIHKTNSSKRNVMIAIACTLVITLIFGYSLSIWQKRSILVSPQQYQCVLLQSGQVYFGKLSGLGSPYLILEDVYYIQQDLGTKNDVVLLKRGIHEWHRPNKMLLNPAQIVLIEPVSRDSLVAKRIREFQDPVLRTALK
ncbi:MAG: hypothetical protein M3Y72_27180 [Acidobacteriota bacterium]|nr:hypothetical protein [Acidobacteriota bacterium]